MVWKANYSCYPSRKMLMLSDVKEITYRTISIYDKVIFNIAKNWIFVVNIIIEEILNNCTADNIKKSIIIYQ